MGQVSSSIVKSVNTAVTFLRWLGVIVLVGILLSGVTFVQPDEVALIIRFGRLAGATPAEQIHQPGLLFAFPYLIDKVIKVPVKKVQEITFNDPYPPSGVGDITRQGFAYLLTGDENIINVKANLKYQISNPVSYGLHVRDPQKAIREIARGVLTQQVAGLSVDYVLVEGKEEIAKYVQRSIQECIDAIDLGIQVVAVEFISIQPPNEVRREFEQVTNAYVKKETMLREARSYSEREIPKAKAFRDQLIRQAQAYKLNQISMAKADVAKFYGVLEEYNRHPQIMHQRLFYEKIEQIISKAGGKVLLPVDQTGGKIILPYNSNGR